MKILILSIFLIVQAFGIMIAQEFLPILEDGREWVEIYEPVNGNMDESDYDVTYKICGRSEFYGHQCFNISNTSEGKIEDAEMIMYEDNGILRMYVDPLEWDAHAEEKCPGECPWLVMIDMSLKRGDFFHGYEVKEVDYIHSGNTLRKRIKFDDRNIWVEGIGATNYRISDFFPRPSNGMYEHLKELSLDGEVIFTYDDFFAPSYDISGVDEVAGEMPLSLQVSQGQICVKAGSQTTVCLRVFSVDGSEVAVVEGKGSVSMPTASFAPGVYVARAVGGGETRTLKWVQGQVGR